MRNWLRTAKRIIRKKSSKKKDLTENPNNKSEYTALDNTADEKLPIISKPLVHTIQRISQKKELDKLINPLISTYFLTKGKHNIEEQTKQPVLKLKKSPDSLCSLM